MNKSTSVRFPRALSWSAAIAGACLGLTLLMLVLSGYFTPKVPSERPAPTRAPVPAGELGEVRLVRRPRVETAIGTVRAVHEAAVAAKILARVVDVKVKAGQTVQQGELLVQLDDADLQARWQQMQAAQTSAEATAERAVVDHERARKLVEKNVISRAEFDQAVASLKVAQAEVQRSRQAVEEAKVLLAFASIRSPLTGVVVEKNVEPGDTATPGQVLVTLFEPERMQMVTTVRESLALRLKVGDQVPARLDALGHECLATVSEIVPRAESSSRSFTVKVTGPCPPGAYSGMFGRISIPLDDEEVLTVPAAAVVRVGQLEMVDVVRDEQATRRAVRIGRPLDKAFEVLAGLRAGDRVVLHSQQENAR